MGELIRFRPRQEARPAGTAHSERNAVPAGGAEILLFTGVRYERHPEEEAGAAKRPAGRNSRRKRA